MTDALNQPKEESKQDAIVELFRYLDELDDKYGYSKEGGEPPIMEARQVWQGVMSRWAKVKGG